MGRLSKASLWLIAPAYVTWRETKSKVSPPAEPFRRWNPKTMRWEALFVIPGAVTMGLAIRFDMPGLAIFGAVWALIGGFKLIARVLFPRRWLESETDFVAMTTGATAVRVAIAVGLAASLALARWTLAVAFGIAEAVLAISGVVAVLVLQRVAASRKATGP